MSTTIFYINHPEAAADEDADGNQNSVRTASKIKFGVKTSISEIICHYSDSTWILPELCFQRFKTFSWLFFILFEIWASFLFVCF